MEKRSPKLRGWPGSADQEQKEIFEYFVPNGTLRSELSDATLSAFAQLAVLRLSATRALISLLDDANQYVLVEATQKSRLRPNRPDRLDREASGDEENLLFGRTTSARSLGLCGHALDYVARLESEWTGEKLWKPPTMPVVVGDVAGNEELRNHPFVTNHPTVRFYAAMPICTASGLCIGTVAVMDERPRIELLSADEIEFLGDLGPTIMAHLEVARISEGHRRGERMIRGLGVFMEGRTDLRDWWRELGDGRHNLGQPRACLHEDDNRILEPDPAPTSSTENLRVTDAVLVETPLEYPAVPSSASQSPCSSPLDAHPPHTPVALHCKPPAQSGPSPNGDGIPKLKSPTRASTTSGGERAPSPPPIRGQSSRTFEPGATEGPMPISRKLREMFDRAGHIIQEAIDVDGALFLDARASTSGERSESATSTEIEAPSRRSSTGNSTTASEMGLGMTPCGVLSLWTSKRSSLHGDGAAALVPLGESFLRRLLNKYPQGHIFSPSESHIEDDGQGHGDHRKEQNEAATIGAMLPGSRSVVVVPLWDAAGERWFAAGCMWTVNPTSRVLTLGADLNYLAAFGNSIMAEVARLEVVGTDRAKSDFISSISHELRSPLHGILASAELLHDTTVDLFQHGMIDTIERCGRTLLDTIQHVLDFAKINNFTRQGSLWGMSSLSVDVNLSLLTEDVVDSVFAGHEFQAEGNNSSPFSNADEVSGFPAETLRGNSLVSGNGGDRYRESTNKEAVDIILDIAWRPNWVFRTESGALRRVLMNLFGNALKYTDRGWVKVSLQAKDIDATKVSITITVTDTGRGISPEYLHGALFTPFTQENPMNPGTGLGLSIVLQIVRSLHGRISITSEPGVGTQVVVTLVMNQAPSPELRAEPRHFSAKSQEAVRSARDKTEGLRVGLLGFGGSAVKMRRPGEDWHPDWHPGDAKRPGEANGDGGGRSARDPALPILRESIESAASQWFGLEIAPVSTWASSPPDILIAHTRAGIRDALPGVPVIALCSHQELYREYSRSAARLVLRQRSTKPELIHFVSKPCGPHKLAEAFDFCLKDTMIMSSRATSPSVAPADGIGSPHQSLFEPTPEIPIAVPLTESQRPREDYFSSAMTEGEFSIRKAAIIAAAAEPPTSPLPRDKKPKLLLVEDNQINLHLLSTFIGRCSFEYDTAENGLEAVQAFDGAGKAHDIIIMDINMPIMDGMEATREIRKLEQGRPRRRRAMIIALTGLGSATSQKDAFDSGVDMFLTKPVRLKDLRKILDDWDPVKL